MKREWRKVKKESWDWATAEGEKVWETKEQIEKREGKKQETSRAWEGMKKLNKMGWLNLRMLKSEQILKSYIIFSHNLHCDRTQYNKVVFSRPMPIKYMQCVMASSNISNLTLSRCLLIDQRGEELICKPLTLGDNLRWPSVVSYLWLGYPFRLAIDSK